MSQKSGTYPLHPKIRCLSAALILAVLVGLALGRPVTREDVRSSLWEGGTIAVTASCEEGRFVADEVETFPPA